jgi:hypothetical protein
MADKMQQPQWTPETVTQMLSSGDPSKVKEARLQ